MPNSSTEQLLLRGRGPQLTGGTSPLQQNNSNDLVLYDYTPQDGHSSFVGTVFLLMFTFSWGFSISLVPLIPLALYWKWRTFLLCITVLTFVAYYPRLKTFEDLRTYLFYNVPKYFHRSSFRFAGGSPPTVSDQVIYLVHPHGIITLGWGLTSVCPYLKHVQFCVSSVLIALPPIRLFTRLIGNPVPCDRRTIRDCLSRGKSIAIIPGGFEEATLTAYGRDRVYLSQRKGIFRYALEYGCKIVPVYVFGESSMYYNVQGLMGLRLWLNRHSIPGVLFFGRMLCPWLPFNSNPHHIVVGHSINIDKKSIIRSEDVDEIHELYVKSLSHLYYSYKHHHHSQLEVY